MAKRGKKPGSPKTGGRVKGTPNKKSLGFLEVLKAKNFCIPSKALELMEHPDATLEIKVKILEFIAAYSLPKLMPAQAKVEEEDFSDIDPDEAEAALAQH